MSTRSRPISAWLCTCLLGALTPVAGFARQAPRSADRMPDATIVEDLRAHVSELAREGRFSGAVLLARGDRVLFAHAYGYADHAFLVPNDIRTKFNFGSMGKMFTAVCIMQLLKEGKLSL